MEDQWSRFDSWHIVTPPNRPSRADLASMRSCLATIPVSRPVAILGATPEYRDMLHSIGFEKIYILDKSVAFKQRMDELVSFDTTNETFIHGDWIETLQKHPNYFSAVLSDFTSGNVDWDRREVFYRAIRRSLVTDGVLLDRILTNEGQPFELAFLDEYFSLSPVNIVTVNEFSLAYLFCSELASSLEAVDSSRFYEALAGRPHSPVIDALLKLCLLVTPPQAVWYYGRPWTKLKAEYERYFKASETCSAGSGLFVGRIELRASRARNV